MLQLSDPGRFAIMRRREIHGVVDKMLDGSIFVLGEMVRRFENEFAQFIGVDHCISVGSGTDALEITLRALECEGKEVMVVANAGGYGTISCLAIGAKPVYVDVDPKTLLISIESIVENISMDTSAIVVTHLFGMAVDCALINNAVMGRLGKIIPIIEDCAQAHGASVGARRAGAQATAGCFSFYPTKNLGALGDGGAIVTNSSALAERISQLRQYGWTKKYLQEKKGGRNSRLDELQAGFLLDFLPHLDKRNNQRRAIVKQYVDSGAAAVHGSFVESKQYVAHLAVCFVNNREALMAKMSEAGIATGIHYPYLDIEFPVVNKSDEISRTLPVSSWALDKILTLPCFPEMTSAEVDHVCHVIVKNRNFFEDL
jgi:aminotransferase EvaB